MRKAIIVLVLLTLVGGGILGGFGLTGIGPLAGLIGERPTKEEAPSEVAVAPPRLINLDTIGVPLFEGNAVRSRLFLNVQMVVPAEQGDKVAANLPRFEDAFLSDLLAYMPRHLSERDKVDMALVRNRLFTVARKVTGGAAIREVTITHAFER